MKQPIRSRVSSTARIALRHAPLACVLTFALALPLKLAAADHALAFATNTHYVSTSAMLTSTTFTVEAWVKAFSFPVENQVASQYAGGDGGRMIVGLKYTNTWFFIGGSSFSGTTAIPSNTWTHLAFVRNGTNCTTYVNGSLDKTVFNMPSVAVPNIGFMIGGINSFNNGFRGQIAEVRAWNTVRTQTEIQNNRSGRIIGNEAGLVGYWRLDEGLGDLALDHAGSNMGTITGASWAYGVGLPVATSDPSGSWIGTTDGNWSDTAKWVGATPAQGANGYAFFTNKPATTLSVANDITGLKLGRLLLSAPSGYAFTGNEIALTNQLVPALVACTNGSHVISAPVVLNSSRTVIEMRSPASLQLTGGLSGFGTLSANPETSGGGQISLSSATSFAGQITLGSGTLGIGTLGTSGSGSETVVIGPATLQCLGQNATVDRALNLNPGSGKASLISVDTNATLSGTVTCLSGALIKRGKGVLTLSGKGPNILGYAQAGNISAFAEYPANGDSPVNGFGGFNVAEGKLILGAEGQTNTVNGEAWVGIRTTGLAGKETAAELEITGGYTRMNGYFVIGRDNGTTNTAPTPLQPKATLTGGKLSVYNFILTYGNDTNHNTRAVFDVRGGTFEVDNEFRFGDQRGNVAVPAFATLNLYGGTIRHTNATQGITFGWRDPAASGAFNINGGLVDEAYRVKMGQYGSRSDLNLNGGVLRAQNIVQSTPSTNSVGQSYVTFNGGTFQPNSAGQTLSGLTSVAISTNGALFDTSLADFTISQNLLHASALGSDPDGGLFKLGTNMLYLVTYGSTYTGPTTVSNGTLKIDAMSPLSSLTVTSGGEALIGGSATQTVSAAGLTLNGTLSLAFTADGASNDRLALSSSPVFGTAKLALYLANSRSTFARNGTYNLMTYSGTNPDVAGLSVASPAYGKRYVFAASGGLLTLTIDVDTTNACIWNSPTGGAWATADNWTVAPNNVTGGIVRFDSAISTPATVQTAGEAVRGIYFNNAAASYTLGGTGLTLTNDAAPASVSVESGTHTIAAPLTLKSDASFTLQTNTVLNLGTVTGSAAALTAQGNGTLRLTAAPSVGSLVMSGAELGAATTMALSIPVALAQSATVRPDLGTTVTVSSVISGVGGLSKAGSNVLSLASANTYTGGTRIDGGTLAVPTLANGGQPSSIGSSPAANNNLVLGVGTLRYTGPSITIDRGYTLNPGFGRSSVLFTQNDLTFAGKIQGTSGGFIKTGPGTLSFTYPGAQTLGVYENALLGLTPIGPFGDSPVTNFQALTILNGKVVVGVPGQTNTVSARMCVGYYTTTTPGAETAAELEINNGAFICNSTVSVGRNNGTTTTAPSGLTSRITINGGAVTFSLLALGYQGISGFTGFNARPACDVNAGSLTLNSYCNIGETAGSTATFNIRGGTVLVKGMNTTGNAFAGFCVGGTGSAGTGTLNISGTGVVYCANFVNLATVSGATGTLNLAGGFLNASNIVKGAGSSATVRFNGGIFQPTATNNPVLGGLTAAYVSTNGALLDTSMTCYTVTQNLQHDPLLGSLSDGGLVKLGTNTLSLTGTNTMNGLLDVRSGTLLARISATNDLNLATNTFFDALGLRATVGDLTGSGTLTNGIIAVTGRLDAGTNRAPAGARMTLQNLSLIRGSTFACDWATNALGQVTNDFAAVTGALAAEGPGFFDLGRSESNPIPLPFRATVMSYGMFSGSFSGWKSINTGLPSSRTTVSVADNLVTLEVHSGGIFIIIK